jgi:glucose dehydrogenase
VLTWHNDLARTGQNLNETILTPANVNFNQFGKLFSISVGGAQVYAQPLYVSSLSIPGKGVHNVLYIATEHDSVYTCDADTGTVLWQVVLLKSGGTPSDNLGCNVVQPVIGITATPARSTMKYRRSFRQCGERVLNVATTSGGEHVRSQPGIRRIKGAYRADTDKTTESFTLLQ